MTDAGELYRALLVSGRLPSLRRLTYRCVNRCLLLDAVELLELGTVLLHQKRYKLSDGYNGQASSPAGRAANTYDGDNHWKSRSYFIDNTLMLDVSPEGVGQQLQCDHVPPMLLNPAQFQRDWTAGHAGVVVRADGSRYAVD